MGAAARKRKAEPVVEIAKAARRLSRDLRVASDAAREATKAHEAVANDTALPKLCKAEKLRLAGEVAPSLRRRAPRKVILVDDAGKPVREATDVEVGKGVLARLGIEIAVQPGQRPEWILCADCGRPVRVHRYASTIPKRCKRDANRASSRRYHARHAERIREEHRQRRIGRPRQLSVEQRERHNAAQRARRAAAKKAKAK